MMRLFCFVYFHAILRVSTLFSFTFYQFSWFSIKSDEIFSIGLITKSDSILIFKRSSASDFIEHRYACAMINNVIRSSLRRGMCECRLLIPYSSNPRGSPRPRVSRRKNPYLSMNSGLKLKIVKVTWQVTWRSRSTRSRMEVTVLIRMILNSSTQKM